MKILDYKSIDVVNGEGTRSSIWFAGCDHQCVGCFSKSTWAYSGFDPDEFKLYERVERDMSNTEVPRRGITLLGGDPLYYRNRERLLKFLLWFRESFPSKDVWMWTGYTHEQCLEDSTMSAIIQLVDVLVDGKFEIENKDLTLKWRGSSNQRVIKITKDI